MVLGGLGVGHVGTGPTCAHSNEAPNALYLRSLCILSCCWDYIYIYVYIYIPSASYLDYRGLPIFQACEQQTKGMHFKGLTLSNATSVRVHSQSTQQGQAQEGLC